MIGHDDKVPLAHNPIRPNHAPLWDLSPTNALAGSRLQSCRERKKLRSKLRRFRLTECHGLPNGVEEGVVLKRLSEKRCRTIPHGRASDGVLVVCSDLDDARFGRIGAELLLEFDTAHAMEQPVD